MLVLESLGSFLEKLAEKSDSVYWLSSPDFAKIEYISPAYEKIWGRSREVLYAEPELWITYLHPDDIKNYHPIHEMKERIIEKGQDARYEENYRIIRPSGEVRWIIDKGFPIYDSDGNCCGVTGVAIDVTAEKELNELKLENATQKYKAQLEAQAEMSKNASQVAHDIRSPISSLLMVVKNCKDIPEMDRVAIREAAISIGDIANNLLNRYKPAEEESSALVETQKDILLSSTLLQLLTEKKFQYTNLPIKFDHHFGEESQLAFIHIEPSSFKRMISNLINNAVDAFEQKEGQVTLKLEVTSSLVKIIIEDNGKGMPAHVKEKILNNMAVTKGKADGHGIGLTQVRETLARNQGKMSIESEINQGTQIGLEFPRISTPDWIASEITLCQDDTIVILDDDNSIHAAWDIRFKSILAQYPTIKVRHFENCHDAVRFIESFSEAEKEKFYLLTDYELLKQELNGLHVVEKAQIKRSILVTSHYADPIVLERSHKMQTKILPKQLAPEVPILINGITDENQKPQSNLHQTVDAVLVDDDKRFSDTLIRFIFKDDRIDYFEDPNQFKEVLKNYSKDTRIYLDNNYKSAGIKGMHLAKELHEMGFTKLYLLTGDTLKPGTTPDYIKVIRKDDIENIKDW